MPQINMVKGTVVKIPSAPPPSLISGMYDLQGSPVKLALKLP